MSQNLNSSNQDVETKDVHVRFTRIAAAAFILSIVVIAIGVYSFYRKQIHQWRDLSGSSIENQFPNPKVFWPGAKAEPVTDFTYRWLNDKTKAEIPVERALDLVATHQLLHFSIQTGPTEKETK